MRLIAWNIARRDGAWRKLLESDADLALLQEANEPPVDVRSRFDIDPAQWHTAGTDARRPWRAAVARISNRVAVEWFEVRQVHDARPGDLVLSRPGTLAAATVTGSPGGPIMVASIYAPWERPHRATGGSWIYADSSVHRVISDLSALIGQQSGHRIIVAGDLNILHGYGEHGSTYWASRYTTVFSRMSALGFSFVGPQAPGGRRAEPWPDELPRTSNNVPTYHTNRQSPATATRQLDFVFASVGLAKHVRVSALNEPADWGPSDHCRVRIEIGEPG